MKNGKIGIVVLVAVLISIASCIQKEEHDEEKPVHVVLMTHETLESNLRAALEEIDQMEFIREETHVLRVL